MHAENDVQLAASPVSDGIEDTTWSLGACDELLSMQQSISDTSVDLGWLIRETLGPAALVDEPIVVDTDFVTPVVLAEEPMAVTAAAVDEGGFDLLEELEAMSQISSEESLPSPTASLDNDHQYTKLASVVVKPYETRKQAIRRVKNNASSRVCRRQRKTRLTTNIGKVAELVSKRDELRRDVQEVEDMVRLLKEHLVSATTARA